MWNTCKTCTARGIEALGREALGVKSADHFVLRGAGLRFTPHVLGGDVRAPTQPAQTSRSS